MTKFMCVNLVIGIYVGTFYWSFQSRLRVWCVYYIMGKSKCEPLIKQTNRFAALAESDSDDETEVVASPERVQDTSGQMQPLNDADDMPPYAPPSPVLEADEAPQFRVWKNENARFSSENNIFSSPFSRKTKKTWSSIEITDLPRGDDDVAHAKAWAAKIEIILDKARKGHNTKKISFFRRTVVLDEKF